MSGFTGKISSRTRTWLSFITDSGSLTTTIIADVGMLIINRELGQVHQLDTSAFEMREFYVQLHLLHADGVFVGSSERVRYWGPSVQLLITASQGGVYLVHTAWSDEHGILRDCNSQTLTVPTCLSVEPLLNLLGPRIKVWVRSNLDVSRMREAMKTEEWYVFGSYCDQAEPAQQYQLNPGKVWELESGKWGCEIIFPVQGVWKLAFEVQKVSGQMQTVIVENK